MSYFAPINSDLFRIVGLGIAQQASFLNAVINIEASLTMSGSSEVSVTVVDPDFTFVTNNYFQIRRSVIYRGMEFEVAAVEVSRSEALHPQYTIQCRSKPVQLMKRDKGPEAYNGISGYDLAQRMASRYGFNFVGELSAKKQAIVKIQSTNTDESVWSALSGLASEQQFVFFESEKTLFFCSEKFLLGKWGDPSFAYGNFRVVPYIWPDPSPGVFPTAKDKYILMDIPTIRRSDDEITAASGSMVADRVNGVNLRPGMTVHIGGIPSFDGPYLITDVSFKEGVPDPVQVQFRTPVEPRPETTTSAGTPATSSRPPSSSSSSNQISPAPGAPTAISQTETSRVRYYTATWLARTNYPGAETRAIMRSVLEAVRRRKTGSQLLSVLQYISGLQGISTSAKNLIREIFNGYMSGKNVNAIPLAGGISATKMSERRNLFLSL